MKNVEDILVEYLAPELAHTVSERITKTLQEGLSSLLLNGAAAASAPAKLTVVAKPSAKPAVVDAPPQAETRRGRPAQTKSGRAKKAARKTARKTAAEGGGAESTREHRTVTPEGRQMMRFKRKVYWARHRLSLGLEALPGDDEIIKADDEGRVLDIDKLAPKKAAANGSRRRTVVAADVGF